MPILLEEDHGAVGTKPFASAHCFAKVVLLLCRLHRTSLKEIVKHQVGTTALSSTQVPCDPGTLCCERVSVLTRVLSQSLPCLRRLLLAFQEGTPNSDRITAAASQPVAGVNSVFLAGTTEGNWSTVNNGSEDYVLVKMNMGVLETASSGTQETNLFSNILLIVVAVVLGGSLLAGCGVLVKSFYGGREERQADTEITPSRDSKVEDPSCFKKLLKSPCGHFVSALLPWLSTIDVGVDIKDIVKYYQDGHPIWASCLAATFVFSCRFTVLFAALNPPPRARVLISFYFFPFLTAYYIRRELIPEKTNTGSAGTGQERTPGRQADELSEEATKCIASYLPTKIRDHMMVRVSVRALVTVPPRRLT